MCNLSIIIPAYNAENYVARCIDSILKSIDIDNYEILLVDDGSIDRTVEIAALFAKEKGIDFLKIIHQKNARQGAARNHGIAKASGQYIMFVDVDDYVNPIGFSKFFYKAVDNDLDLLRFAVKIYDPDGDFSISCDAQFEEEKIYKGTHAILNNYNISSVWGALFKRKFIIDSDVLFRTDIAHEDCEFILHLLPKAKRIMISSACLYSYCWNNESTDREQSLQNILHLRKSDIIVAQSYIKTADVIPVINECYYRKGNSLVTSFLLSLIRSKDCLSKKDRLDLLNFAKSQEVYPMKRFRTLSWKTTLLKIFLNNPRIEKMLICLFNTK